MGKTAELTRLYMLQAFRIKYMHCIICQLTMKRDEVARRQQVVESIHPPGSRGKHNGRPSGLSFPLDNCEIELK